ncbi:extracellular catalytic domain type 1 short-chain-length polyhydroxyalkanoate depolymerase [Paraliomyxa miuraensis]|uniref:extracellular catalytic domain type 1 short-chain-length polyhydroxyalkanoate depolymerase n=1 Tax=Paraliomyxa miuraensis TaxID=376150 RepID=UPI00225B417E|nr:PHB depolymerase family esterase [Paraliomyxa miuraensis]MCX4244364.1 PHB depolymerase family esterase [Paraliomyxa miuraensis]
MVLGLGCAPVDEADFEVALRSGWNVGARGGLSGALYTPVANGTIGDGRSLLVVLHGCSQSYGNLQTYGNWVDTAEEHGMVISLPGVAGGGVYFGCWDYYGGTHSRNGGDAADILGHVNALLADPSLGIDPDQVYIAGLSSGGGMAMVMACLAPDVFAGVGIAAGPTVGTTAFQISSVSTNAGTAQATCESLAGTHAGDFDTQLAAVISGTNDYTVAQGYATLNAQVFANIYADAAGGGALGTASLAVESLPGYQPAGTGSVRTDEHGTRVASISATGMGHAWPAGSGSGYEISFVARQGVDFAAVLADLFTSGNRRVEHDAGMGGSGDTDGGDTGGGGTTGDDDGGTTSGDDGGTTAGDDAGDDAGTTAGGDDAGDDAGTTAGDDAGDDAGTTAGGEEPCEPWVNAVTATISGHFSRFGVHPGGYGAADITYVALFSIYGMNTAFTLYQGTNGAWYHDPANLPGAGCP